MATVIGRADSVSEAHANYKRLAGVDYVPNKFARKGAAYYGRVAWGLTPKEVREVLALLTPCARGEFRVSYENTHTSRACSSGVGTVPVGFDYFSRHDFDRVAGEGCDQ